MNHIFKIAFEHNKYFRGEDKIFFKLIHDIVPISEKPDEIIFNIGDSPKLIYIISEGQVSVSL